MKAKQSKKQTIFDILLMVVFTMLSVSGINLHLAAKNGMDRLVWGMGHSTWQTLHIVSAILTLIFISIHIYQYRNWYKNLLKSSGTKRKRKKGTIALTVIFAMVILTGLIDWISNVPNSTLGLIHAKLGQIMILFVIVHIYNRLPAKAGFGKKKPLQGIPQIHQSRCDRCGACARVCPKGVFTMQEISDWEARELNFIGKQKIKHKGRTKSYPINTDACIHCGICTQECHEGAIKFVS